MTKREQTRDELLRHYFEQMRRLQRSARVFDTEDFAEARALSVPLRTLFHTSRSNRPLLEQLEIIPDLALYTSVSAPIGRNLFPNHDMVMLGATSDRRASYVPTLGGGPPGGWPGKKRFLEWWNDPVFDHPPTGVTFSRREFVTYVAEQDGGVHVDPAISEKWALLARDGKFAAIQVRSGIAAPVKNMDLAHVRQIAEEVMLTLNEHPELSSSNAPPVNHWP